MSDILFGESTPKKLATKRRNIFKTNPKIKVENT